jgi:tetratricopeptide (TPR) repeat protein
MGKRSPALTHYSLATVADPTDAEPLAALSRALAAVGNRMDAHRFMGRYYDLKERPAEAVREYERMAAAAPASAEPAALVGQVYLRTRQNGRAMAVTDTALKRHPDDESLLERRAVLSINSGDWGTARQMLQRWMTAQPKASLPLWLMGRCALGELKLPEAVSWLEKAVAEEPHNAHYLGFLGGALLRSDAPQSRERAAKVLAEATELAPDEAEYQALYGQALQRLGQDEAARRAFLRALDADPLRVDAYLAVSQLARRLKRPAPGSLFAAAVRDVQQRASEETSLATHVWWQPNDLSGRLAFARYLCRTGQLARARDVLEPAQASAEAWRLREVVQRCLEAL